MYDNSARNKFECDLCDWCMQVEVVCVALEMRVEDSAWQQAARVREKTRERGRACVCIDRCA